MRASSAVTLVIIVYTNNIDLKYSRYFGDREILLGFYEARADDDREGVNFGFDIFVRSVNCGKSRCARSICRVPLSLLPIESNVRGVDIVSPIISFLERAVNGSADSDGSRDSDRIERTATVFLKNDIAVSNRKLCARIKVFCGFFD